MKLAKDVANDSGMVLIVKNTLLTPELIVRLNNMSIESVSIVTPGSAMMPKDKMFAELQKRFLKTNGEPLNDSLRKLCEQRIEELYQNAP